MISVSRPNTVMNHGMPAAGSFHVPPPSPVCICSAARSFTDCPNACSSSSQLVSTRGTCTCHASSEARTRARSPPKCRITPRGARSGRPSRPVTTSIRSTQRCRGFSFTSYETPAGVSVPRFDRITCVRPKPSRSVSTYWLRSSSEVGSTGSGSGFACLGSPSEKSHSFTDMMSAKSAPNSIPIVSSSGFIVSFRSTR